MTEQTNTDRMSNFYITINIRNGENFKEIGYLPLNKVTCLEHLRPAEVKKNMILKKSSPKKFKPTTGDEIMTILRSNLRNIKKGK